MCASCLVQSWLLSMLLLELDGGLSDVDLDGGVLTRSDYKYGLSRY